MAGPCVCLLQPDPNRPIKAPAHQSYRQVIVQLLLFFESTCQRQSKKAIAIRENREESDGATAEPAGLRLLVSAGRIVCGEWKYIKAVVLLLTALASTTVHSTVASAMQAAADAAPVPYRQFTVKTLIKDVKDFSTLFYQHILGKCCTPCMASTDERQSGPCPAA